MRVIGQERHLFGYRRLHVLLKREGYLINHKAVSRLYREERLTVRRRGGRKRAIGTRAPMTVPMAPNERWSLDFVSDQLTDGRRFRSDDGGLITTTHVRTRYAEGSAPAPVATTAQPGKSNPTRLGMTQPLIGTKTLTPVVIAGSIFPLSTGRV
jgi:transposase InsO family protein